MLHRDGRVVQLRRQRRLGGDARVRTKTVLFAQVVGRDDGHGASGRLTKSREGASSRRLVSPRLVGA